MKFTDFKNGLENGEEFSVYLFVGEDAFFRERGVSMLINKFVSEKSVNYSFYSGEDCDLKDVLSSFSMLPFMSKKRLTQVNELYLNKEQLSELKSYFKVPVTDGILAISNQSVKNSEGLKSIEGICVVDCEKADTSTIIKWIKSKCNESGINIEYETAKYISDACLNDMKRIETETEKLISYAIKDKELPLESVKDLISVDTDYKIYEMTDCLGRKEIDSALKIITDLMKKEDNSIGIISGIYKHFRRLLHTSISGMSNVELSDYFGIKEFAVEKLRGQSKKFSPKSLKKAVDLLSKADYVCKTGESNVYGITWSTIFSILIN